MREQPERAGAAPAHEERLIVVAHDLSPADMILFKQHQYAGFVTDLGGVTSHTAILARSLDIPAIVGAHSARQMVREGELVIVDGVHGVLIVAPDELVLAQYQQRQRELELRRQRLKRIRSTPATTRDALARYTGSLAGRVALVSGAGTGIGRATSLALAAAGADVALLGRRKEPLDEVAALIGGIGRRAVVCPVDVTDASAVDDAAPTAG